MRTWIRALLVALALLFAAPALAEKAPDTGTPEVDFQAADPSESRHKENLSGVPFLAGAYMVIWAGMLAYLVTLQRRQQSVQSEIADLRKALADHDAKAA